MKSINPATTETFKTFDEYSDSQIDDVIEATQKCFKTWSKTSFKDRAIKFRRLSECLRDQKNDLAALMANEMGKPITEGVSEVEKCAWVCEYYAENAEIFLAPISIETDFTKSHVVYNPLGVILAVMPWNYPLWQVFRFAAPTLMAGNTGVLKHASNVSGCSLAIEKLFIEAGFPENCFSSLLVNSKKVSGILGNKYIKAVSLTGSTNAGKSVAAAAGENLKKAVLELGGSDPYLILDNNKLKETVKKCAKSRLLNGGQSCVSAKRFIVLEEIHDEFVTALKTEMESFKQGDPLDKETQLGPMAREDLRSELHDIVSKTITAGAECITGGKIPNTKGCFYPVTILDGVKDEMLAFREELFGPVATIISAKDIADAVRIANDSDFGLGSAIFSSDIEMAMKLAENEIEAGACFVNDFVKSDPRLPFGGIKYSGYGRELSENGIKEFVNIKTVCLK